MWTRFFDMHSGGGSKEYWEYIYIEAPEDKAKIVFYNKFGHNPERVTCTCCGEDYSISSSKTLKQLTGFERGCDYVNKKYIEKPNPKGWYVYYTLAKFKKDPSRLFIYKKDIKPEELVGNVPVQGYVYL